MIEYAFAVLKHLSDGHFHASTAIAKALGCPCSLVDQAVQVIQHDLGLTVFRVRGQGYRLMRPFQWLDVKSVYRSLSSEAAAMFRLVVIECTPSTNSQLLAQAAEAGVQGMVLATEQQTVGRGRLGRRWQSRLGSSLTFSIMWRFERSMAELSGLSLAVGVAIARALHRLGVWVALKWPNDVLLHGRKLAGTLIELSSDVLTLPWAIIGIGLNVHAPGEVAQPVAALDDVGCGADRNALLAVLLNELYPVLLVFNQQGFVPFAEEWMALSAHDHRRVVLFSPSVSEIKGIACGVTEQGALLLQTEQGLQTFHAGEVSLRGMV